MEVIKRSTITEQFIEVEIYDDGDVWFHSQKIVQFPKKQLTREEETKAILEGRAPILDYEDVYVPVSHKIYDIQSFSCGVNHESHIIKPDLTAMRLNTQDVIALDFPYEDFKQLWKEIHIKVNKLEANVQAD
jgi:hypothetical protein